jgi:aspartyl aminopeptidase
MTLPSGVAAATDLARFIDASPTPYHAVQEVSRRLEAAGFRALDERAPFRISPGERFYAVRGGGSIVAFIAGETAPSEAGFRLVGSHTDSPNLRVKPRADMRVHGHHQLGVEVYGSPLLHTWLDRDLGMAGRVSLLDGSTHLVRIDQPVCRISSLAVHLSPTLAADGLRLNPQQHMVPTFALGNDTRPHLTEVLAKLLGKGGTSLSEGDVVAFDLALFDVQGAAFCGAERELLASARLDNLASCHAAVTALAESPSGVAATRGIVLYDHEEVGSQSAIGASSSFLRTLLDRIATAYTDSRSDAGARARLQSFLVSADMAHAIHPNHVDRHDPQHAPRLGSGPVIKVNANQSYATDGPSAAVFERACREAGFPAQRFVSRNDMRCGSTIGPISAARLGMRTVDVGNPMLSMHSCREVCAAEDVGKMVAALARVFELTRLPDPSE